MGGKPDHDSRSARGNERGGRGCVFFFFFFFLLVYLKVERVESRPIHSHEGNLADDEATAESSE